MERFKSEKIYPRIFAMTIAVITTIIAIYSIVTIAGEVHTIFPLSRSGYTYLIEKACIIVSLILLVIYLVGYYGREKNNFYNISLVLLIIYLAIPVVEEIINTSFTVMPSKLGLAKIIFRVIMIVAICLLLIENTKHRDGKIQILIFGTLFTGMFIALVVSTAFWITGGYANPSYYWRTAGEEFMKNIDFVPYILSAYFCSKNYAILHRAKEKNIELEKSLLKRIKENRNQAKNNA